MFTYAKTILIGDAAHPNLPFNGQGGNQALEDCAVLLRLFSDVPSRDPDVIDRKIKLFDMVRWRRASRIQVTSGVPGESVRGLEEKLKEFVEDDLVVEGEEYAMAERWFRDLT